LHVAAEARWHLPAAPGAARLNDPIELCNAASGRASTIDPDHPRLCRPARCPEPWVQGGRCPRRL